MTPPEAPTALPPGGAAPADRQTPDPRRLLGRTHRAKGSRRVTPTQSSLPFDAGAPQDGGFDALARHALPAEPGVWDELRGADGAPRPRWRRFANLLPAPPAGLDLAADLDRRVAQVAQQIRLDGVTHNVFDEQGVASRPWSLELLPLLIEPAEWAAIEAGVEQRAALLEAMLADLYGPRRLLCEGLLPPALLMRHPGYLRPMIGVAPAGGLRLHIVAFDLARGPDGRWWVVAQRTQGPSGLGYVLHNRLVISRQFPDAFRELRVQHIASSYRAHARHGRAEGVGRRRRRDTARRAAHAGAVQRDLFRACLPGALPGAAAGRGRRPDGA